MVIEVGGSVSVAYISQHDFHLHSTHEPMAMGGGAERCRTGTVLLPFLYRHAPLVVVVVVLRRLRLGAAYSLSVSWPSRPSTIVCVQWVYTYCCCGTFVPSEPTSII